jgi:hypothetical protein
MISRYLFLSAILFTAVANAGDSTLDAAIGGGLGGAAGAAIGNEVGGGPAGGHPNYKFCPPGQAKQRRC